MTADTHDTFAQLKPLSEASTIDLEVAKLPVRSDDGAKFTSSTDDQDQRAMSVGVEAASRYEGTPTPCELPP